jgi:hypothetical protein
MRGASWSRAKLAVRHVVLLSQVQCPSLKTRAEPYYYPLRPLHPLTHPNYSPLKGFEFFRRLFAFLLDGYIRCRSTYLANFRTRPFHSHPLKPQLTSRCHQPISSSGSSRRISAGDMAHNGLHSCNICDKTFKRPQELKRHRQDKYGLLTLRFPVAVPLHV